MYIHYFEDSIDCPVDANKAILDGKIPSQVVSQTFAEGTGISGSANVQANRDAIFPVVLSQLNANESADEIDCAALTFPWTA